MDWNSIQIAMGKRGVQALAVAVFTFAVGTSVAAERAASPPGLGDYPNRNVELIIPFAAGGGVDLFGRTVAQLLNDQKLVTRPIRVVNRPGAGGSIGMTLIVNRKGDPYSLLGIAIHAIVTPLTLGTPYSYRDMTPIAKLFTEYQMMVVRTASPFKTLKDVEAALRKDPGSLSIGGASLGNADHIAVAKFASAIGIDPGKLPMCAPATASRPARCLPNSPARTSNWSAAAAKANFASTRTPTRARSHAPTVRRW